MLREMYNMWYVLLIAVGASLYQIESIHPTLELCNRASENVTVETLCVRASVRIDLEMGSTQ